VKFQFLCECSRVRRWNDLDFWSGTKVVTHNCWITSWWREFEWQTKLQSLTWETTQNAPEREWTRWRWDQRNYVTSRSFLLRMRLPSTGTGDSRKTNGNKYRNIYHSRIDIIIHRSQNQDWNELKNRVSGCGLTNANLCGKSRLLFDGGREACSLTSDLHNYNWVPIMVTVNWRLVNPEDWRNESQKSHHIFCNYDLLIQCFRWYLITQLVRGAWRNSDPSDAEAKQHRDLS
jgi:hypothetical protein